MTANRENFDSEGYCVSKDDGCTGVIVLAVIAASYDLPSNERDAVIYSMISKLL